jgi:hypothetical protein
MRRFGKKAAEIKSTGSLSAADAWTAATAAVLGAILVHKDPAFRSLTHVAQELLTFYTPEQITICRFGEILSAYRAYHRAAGSADKTLRAIQGANHYYVGRPANICRKPWICV